MLSAAALPDMGVSGRMSPLVGDAVSDLCTVSSVACVKKDVPSFWYGSRCLADWSIQD